MPLSPPDFDQLFAAGARHELPGGDVATVQLRPAATLWMPSGEVVAGEPYGFDDSDEGFVQRVPPGHYPVLLVVAAFEQRSYLAAYDQIAAARLVIRDEPVASWELALRHGQDLAELDDDEYFGYPVDGGTGGFVDAASIPALSPNRDDYFDRLAVSLAVNETDETAPATLTDAEGRTALVAFSSGGGDGFYPTWVGRTAGGEVACFLTDFFILTDDDDNCDDGIPPTHGPDAEGREAQAARPQSSTPMPLTTNTTVRQTQQPNDITAARTVLGLPTPDEHGKG